MAFIVQDFLDYSQIIAGKFRVNKKPFKLRQAVENVMSFQARSAQMKQTKLEVEFENIPEDLQIISDEQRLMQVLLNLQSNALKFTDQGSVKILVKLVTEGLNQVLQISVKDTGAGISIEDQDKLFKLFGFVQDAKGTNVNGIGLGLVISEQIVQKLDGRIWFKSEENVGSTFTFTVQVQSCSSNEFYLPVVRESKTL
jgi:signal transduction histidine kinase